MPEYPPISKALNCFHPTYSVELYRIDPEYDDYIVSFTNGITSEIFKESKMLLNISFIDAIQIRHEHSASIGPAIPLCDLKFVNGRADPVPHIFAEDEIPEESSSGFIALSLDRNISLDGRIYALQVPARVGRIFSTAPFPSYHQLYETLKRRLTNLFDERIKPRKTKDWRAIMLEPSEYKNTNCAVPKLFITTLNR
jgi:hypothetical protein